MSHYLFCFCADKERCWCINIVEMPDDFDSMMKVITSGGVTRPCDSCARGDHMTGTPPPNFRELVKQQAEFIRSQQ